MRHDNYVEDDKSVGGYLSVSADALRLRPACTYLQSCVAAEAPGQVPSLFLRPVSKCGRECTAVSVQLLGEDERGGLGGSSQDVLSKKYWKSPWLVQISESSAGL